MKKVYKVILIIISFIVLIFWLWYITRVMNDLKETNIKEYIIVSLKWKSWLFLIDPNTEKIETFSWAYNKIEKVSLDIKTRVFSPNKEYYFNIWWIFSKKNVLLNRTWLSPINDSSTFWTNDSKYLIRTDWRVVRLFWMFFSTPTLEQVIHVVDPATKKSKQILLYDENGKLLQVESIEWYITK